MTTEVAIRRDEFIELVAAVDGVPYVRRRLSRLFRHNVRPRGRRGRGGGDEAAFLKAYRWHYINSGAQHLH
jgi:hypothetical protein